ncbi:MAG: DUF5615 family PIN-like protein [Myxococcales bacterium]
MRLKLDENLPTILVEDLVDLGHDVDTAVSEGLAGHEDPQVWSGAQAAGSHVARIPRDGTIWVQRNRNRAELMLEQRFPC